MTQEKENKPTIEQYVAAQAIYTSSLVEALIKKGLITQEEIEIELGKMQLKLMEQQVLEKDKQ